MSLVEWWDLRFKYVGDWYPKDSGVVGSEIVSRTSVH